MLSSNRTVTSSEIPAGPAAPCAELPRPGTANAERLMNFLCDSSMNSAAAAKRSGFRGASTSKAFGKSPCTTPKAISASGSSVATTLPATTTGQRRRCSHSLFNHSEKGLGAGSSMSYFRFPLVLTRSSGAPRARILSASASVCIRKAVAFLSTEARNGRRKNPKILRYF